MKLEKGTINTLMKRWDTNTLQWVVWDGSLTVGSVTIGSVTNAGSGKTLKRAIINLSSTGTVVSGVTSKKIKLYSYKLVCSAGLTVNWRSGGTTALEGPCSFAANGGITESVTPPDSLFETAAGESLDLVISGTGTVGGIARYWDDDTV